MKITCNKNEFANMLTTCHGNAYSGDDCTCCVLKNVCAGIDHDEGVSPVVGMCEIVDENKE